MHRTCCHLANIGLHCRAGEEFGPKLGDIALNLLLDKSMNKVNIFNGIILILELCKLFFRCFHILLTRCIFICRVTKTNENIPKDKGKKQSCDLDNFI